MRRNCNRTLPKPSSSPVITNIGYCTITNWPKPLLDASARCCQVTAGSYTPLQQLREAKDVGTKVLPIGNGASPSIRGIRRYSLKWRLHMRRFDNSQERKSCTIGH